MFKIVYWYEHPYDAQYDAMSEEDITADSAEDAIEKFHEENGCSVIIQCVIEVK